MLVLTRIRAPLLALATASLLAGCGLPPLHRSVAVETDNSGTPVHASGSIRHDHYTVVRGDTLYSIAFLANLDYRQLAHWNGISAPYTIHPGQVLRLSPPPGVASQPRQAPVFQTVAPPMPRAPSPKPSPGTAVTAVATGAASGVADTARVVASTPKKPVVAKVSPPHEETRPTVPTGPTRRVGGVEWRWPTPGVVLNHYDAAASMPGINIAGKLGDPIHAAASGVVIYSGSLVGYGELIIIKHDDDYLSAYGHNSERLVHEGDHVQAGQLIARMGATGASRDELEFQIRYKGKPVNPLKYLPQH